MISKYNSYIESGISGIQFKPNSWRTLRIKDLISKIGSGVTPKGGSEVYVDTGTPFLRSQNIYDDGLRISNVSYIDEITNNKMKNSQVKPDDILINITGASIGRTCIIPKSLKQANINQHIVYLRIKKKEVCFLSYFLKSKYIKDYIMKIQAGSSKEALTIGQILNISLNLPPKPEQLQIAQYLDQKTTAIDKKIELLQQKAEKYKDYRKSIVYELATGKKVWDGQSWVKPTKIKDSGLDWLKNIPDHWEIKRIKDLFKISRGRVIAQTELVDNGQFPVYSSQTANNGCLGYINTFDFNKSLITWTTDGVNAGTVFLRTGKFNCTNICGTLIPNKEKHNLNYLTSIIGESTKHNKRIDTNGAKIMSNEMQVIKIPFPPIEEQSIISNQINSKTSQIDKITTNIKTQIDTLKELKTTLINDVVTGKIKVTETDT